MAPLYFGENPVRDEAAILRALARIVCKSLRSIGSELDMDTPAFCMEASGLGGSFARRGKRISAQLTANWSRSSVLAQNPSLSASAKVIRFINCIKRRDDLTVDEFRRFWNNPLFSQLQEDMAKALGATRWARSLTLVVEANTLFKDERGLAEPGDGVLEYWWENARDLVKLIESPEGLAARGAMTEYQRQFVDFAATRAFFTEAEGDLAGLPLSPDERG